MSSPPAEYAPPAPVLSEEARLLTRRLEVLDVAIRRAEQRGLHSQLAELKRQAAELTQQLDRLAAHQSHVASSSSSVGVFPSSQGIPVQVMQPPEETKKKTRKQLREEKKLQKKEKKLQKKENKRSSRQNDAISDAPEEQEYTVEEPAATSSVRVLALARALYDHVASQEDELSFWGDDDIELLRMEGNWWEGKIAGTEEVGLIPNNYVEVIEVYTEAEPDSETSHSADSAAQAQGQYAVQEAHGSDHVASNSAATLSMAPPLPSSRPPSAIPQHIWEMKRQSTETILRDLERCESMKSQYFERLAPLVSEMRGKFEALSADYLKRLEEVFDSVQGCLNPTLEAEIVMQERQAIANAKDTLFGEKNAALRLVEGHVTSVKKFVKVKESIVRLQALVRGWLVRRRVASQLKNARQRTKLAKEILQTEVDYVRHIRSVVEGYLRPLHGANEARRRTDQTPYCTEQEFDNIFLNLEVILNTNTTILTTLEKEMANYNPWTTCLGKVFLQIAPYLRVYTQYVNNVDNAMEVLDYCKKNRRGFERFVNECAARLKESGHNQNVASLAIMPVQRIPRYSLLLKSYLKYTDESHPDYTDLQAALTAILNVAAKLNESRRTSEARKKVAEIQKQLIDYKHLVQPHRYFIREGELETDSISMIRALPSGPSKRTASCWFFLFNDVLLVAEESSRTSLSLLDMIGSSKAQFKVREVIPVRKIAIDETPGVPGYPHAFEMQVSNRQPDRFFTKTLEDRDAWIVSIRNALKESDDRRKTIKLDPKRSWKPLPSSPAPSRAVGPPANRPPPAQQSSDPGPSVGQFHPIARDSSSSLFPSSSARDLGHAPQPHTPQSQTVVQPPAPTGSGSTVALILELFSEVFAIEKSLFQLPIQLTTLLPQIAHTMPVGQLNMLQPRLQMLHEQVQRLNAIHQRLSHTVRNERLFHTLNMVVGAGKNPIFSMKLWVQRVYPPGHVAGTEPRELLKALIMWYTDLMKTWALVTELKC